MSRPKLTYEVGDPVWIDVCCQGRLQGVVIGEYRLIDDPAIKYIIRINDPEFPHEEIRDALLMSPVEDEPQPYTSHKTHDPRH